MWRAELWWLGWLGSEGGERGCDCVGGDCGEGVGDGENGEGDEGCAAS